MHQILILFIFSSLHTVLGAAAECLDNGFVCSGKSDGDTEYCSEWAANSTCYSGKCYSSHCKPSNGIANKKSACVNTGYGCLKDGDKDFCARWAADSICWSGNCYTPHSCMKENSNITTPSSQSLADVVKDLALLEDLLERLQAIGVDKDDVPEKFERLIREMNKDAVEADFGSDMTIDDMVNVYKALGYKDTEKVSGKIMRAFFDDEINVYGGDDKRGKVAGKVAVSGVMYSDSFTITTCIDAKNKVPYDARLRMVNSWNENKRMSTAYINSDDSSFCLQSDQQLTKYAKANIQLAKEQASYFIVSVQVFHKEILKTRTLHNDL